MRSKNYLLIALVLTVGSICSAQSRAPDFKQYAAKVEKTKNIKVDLKSHRDANMFRTNLRTAAKEGVNFGGHFVLTTWGCGTNCSQSAIIEARSGKVFFPEQLAGIGIGFCDLPDETEPLVYKANSRLLVLSGSKGGDLSQKNGRCGIYYFEWTGKVLKQVRFVPKKRSETP